MEQIYFRKWVSGEGKRLDSENKHIFFYKLGYLLFRYAAPLVPLSLWKRHKPHRAHLNRDNSAARFRLFY